MKTFTNEVNTQIAVANALDALALACYKLRMARDAIRVSQGEKSVDFQTAEKATKEANAIFSDCKVSLSYLADPDEFA